MVGGSYKQQCPSCETMVLIKSPALVGKRIECPRCKDRFLVAKPVPAKKSAEDEADEAMEQPVPAPRPKLTKLAKKPIEDDAEEDVEDTRPTRPDVRVKPGAPGKKLPAKVRKDEPEDEEAGTDDEELTPARPENRVKPGVPGKKPPLKMRDAPPDEEPAKQAKGKPNGKLGKAVKPAPPPVEEEAPEQESAEGEDEAAAPPKKRRFNLNFKINLGNKKMALGLGLAVVGVVVLAAAGYFILGGSQSGVQGIKRPSNPFPIGPPIPPAPIKDKDKDKGKTPGKDGKVAPVKEGKTKDKGPDEPPPPALELTPAGPELTNLLPPDTEQIARINLKNLLDTSGPFYELVFNAFNTPGPFSEAILKQRLGFSATKIDEIYQAEHFSGPLPWSFTVVHVMEALDMKKIARAINADQVKKPIKGQVYFQVTDNPWLEQLGKMAPGVPPSVRQLLPQREGRPLFVFLHGQQTLILGDEQPMTDFLNAEGQFPFHGAKKDPKKGGPKKDPMKQPMEAPSSGAYMTVRPDLKALMEKNYFGDQGSDQFLVGFASDLTSASTASKLPQHRGLLFYRPRPFWDLTNMLEERKPKLKSAYTSIIQRGPRTFQYRAEFTCKTDEDLKDFRKELDDFTVPRIVQLADQLLELKIETNFVKGRAGSYLEIKPTPLGLSFIMELSMDQPTFARASELFALLMTDVHGELALWEDANLRHRLGKAADQVARKGLDKRLEQGRFPPAAFPRPGRDRQARDPGQRISFLAGLLPFLGEDKLYERIQFESSWQDLANWPVGRTIIPQFLDPSYPDWSRTVAYPNFPVELGATHYVGVAGVGLDAAEYPLGHPKRGILGNDQSASIADVQKGRGLSNTMLMIQVPPDSVGGVTPWIAGGGSTLRGIPERNSIEPFVLTRDRNGKPMQYNGRGGTYAVMADGSVRFITSKASDDVVQSMATYQGPAIDLDKNGETPKVPEQELEKKDPKK